MTNLQTEGTFSESNGLKPNEISLDDAEKLLSQSWGKSVEDVKKIDLSAPVADPVPEPEKVEPTPAPTETATQEPVAQSTPPNPTPDQPTDPYAWLQKIEDEELRNKIGEEIRAKLDAEHRFRSANGRVSAFQHKALELQRQLAEATLNRARNSPPSDSAAPSTPKTAKEWEALIETDPDLAKAVDARFDSKLQEIEQRFQKQFGTLKESTIDPLYEHQSIQYLQREQELLLQAVPNYQEVVTSEPYKMWLNNLSPSMRSAVDTCQNHQDAVRYLRMFAYDLQASGMVPPPPQQAAPVPAKPSTTQAAPLTTEQADKLQKDREARLTTPAVTTSVPTPVPATAHKNEISLEDAEALLEKYWEESAKKRKTYNR